MNTHLFIDNYETTSGKLLNIHDIFSYGGLLIEDAKLKTIENRFNEIKRNYNIPSYLPLKWNFKDDKLRKVYEKSRQIELWKKIIPLSKEIRKDVIRILTENELKVIFSSFRKLPTAEISVINLYQCALTNILQRAFFDSSDIEIIIDWEDKFRDYLSRAHFWPYYFDNGIHGETFLRDCLSNLKMSKPYSSFSITIHNPFLQIIDIATGCCGSFVECCVKGKEDKFIFDSFTALAKSIRGYNQKQLFSWGFLIKPAQDKEVVEKKLLELGVL